MKKFFVKSTYGEILDVALRLQDEGNEVVFWIPTEEYKKIGDGLISKDYRWWNYLGKEYIFVVDGCQDGAWQDWLRSRGEAVFGGSEIADKLENDRQMGQKMFKRAGFYQPESHNFTDIDEALAFVQDNTDKRWILKQNGDAPKSINHMGKFDDGMDMILHLEHLKKTWNEAEYGKFDCDLMEIVKGTEVAASAFWNGTDWMRDKDNKVVGFLNWEEKKECNNSLGATTGEMGTTFLGVTGDNELFSTILINPKIEKTLKDSGFRGVFDINGTVLDDGTFVGFEPTCRFGVPSSSYEFIEGLNSSAADLIEAVARGRQAPVDIKQEVGMVIVVAAKPFPVEAHLKDDATSQGEILWFLNEDGQEDLAPSDEQMQHIHFANTLLDEYTGQYRVATENGYLLTVTGHGRTIEGVRSDLIDYIESNLYISGMKYRTDIGVRAERHLDDMRGHKDKVLIDFDGVIHDYTGYSDTIDGDMIEGAKDAIMEIVKRGYSVSIFTARTDFKKVKDWLYSQWPDWRLYIDDVSNVKRPAIAYIDDRAIHFTDWEQALKDFEDLV